MKQFILSLSTLLVLGSTAYAADVICRCEDDSCKAIEINFVPSSPGVYLNVKYNDGAKILEGFATITSNKDRSRVYYKLNNFLMVKDNGEYSMPTAADRVCK